MLPPEGRDGRFHEDTRRREGRPQESRFDDSYCQRPLSFRPVCSPSAPRLGRERLQGRCDSLTDFSRRILGDRRTCSRAHPHRLAIRCPHGHPHEAPPHDTTLRTGKRPDGQHTSGVSGDARRSHIAARSTPQRADGRPEDCPAAYQGILPQHTHQKRGSPSNRRSRRDLLPSQRLSNEEMIRRIEDQGGEAWLAGVSEWIWYTTEEQFRRYREENRRFSRDWLKTMLTKQVQLRDEHALVEDFHDLFAGREEPHVPQLLELANPYLPSYGSMGEMVLSTGGAIYLHKKGADGIMDISPFTCMNGIITEAVYPKVSREHNNIPVRVFYFDGTQSDLDRDVGIFLELAKTYRRRKTTH